MAKPPIFSSMPTGTLAKQYLRRAKMFKGAADIVVLACWAVAGVFASANCARAASPSWEGWHNAPPPSTARYLVSKEKVIALAGLSKPCGLTSSGIGPMGPISGKIVKRSFDPDGITLGGIVVETETGERTFVNVEAERSLEADNVDLADRGWIIQGLKKLLRQGADVAVDVQYCGASGRVRMLDGVRLANGAPPASEPQAKAEPTTQPSPAAQTDANLGATLVPLRAEGGTFVVPVQINGALTLDFTIDSGAADVSIPADVVLTLMRTGTITSADFLGEQTYQLADGSTVPSQRFVIRSLKVGDKVIENVTGSIASVKGSLLLGQSFLGAFKSWSLDNQRHVLILD